MTTQPPKECAAQVRGMACRHPRDKDSLFCKRHARACNRVYLYHYVSDDARLQGEQTKTTQAIYWPAEGKLLARITLEGKFVAIFKAPPTDEQGNAMAKAMVPTVLPDECAEQHWDQSTDDYGIGFNACLKLWKESLK